jgi:cytochrome c556
MNMKRSRLLVVVGLAMIAVGAAALAATPVDTVKERQALMKGLGKNMTAIKDFVAGTGGETAADIARRATEMNESATKIIGLFPAGTGPYVAVTAALPTIWSDQAGFEAAAQRLVEETAALIAAANGGDKAAIEAQFGNTGKNACGGCHTKYREKK